MLSGEQMQVPGRPIYWLGAVCDSTKAPGTPSPEAYVAVIDYLETQLGIEHSSRKKREYIETYAVKKPEVRQKVRAILANMRPVGDAEADSSEEHDNKP